MVGLAILLLASPVSAAYWVIMSDGAVKFGGYNRRQGPFATRAAAEAYVRAVNLPGSDRIVSDGADTPQTVPDNTAQERITHEKNRKQQEFESDKADAINSLKGVNLDGPILKTGRTIIDNTPRGFGRGGLGDTGIKDVRPDQDVRDLGGPESAWKQLNGAAYLANSAVSKSDPTEMLYLAIQVTMVMNGESLGVRLPEFKAMPRPATSSTPGAEYREATKLILADVSRKAAVLVEKARRVDELAKTKAVAETATKTARETLANTPLSPGQPATPGGAPRVLPKPSAMEEARAALRAALQAEADANRAVERADAEAKLTAQQINSSLRELEALDKNPGLAPAIVLQMRRTSVAQ